MDTSSSDSSSLSHLSSLLVSHGYLSRPLLLHPTSPDPTTRRREEDKSTAQITKCLWSMLSARLSSSESLEKLGTQVRVLSYENERMEGKLSRGEREVENARKEVEKERGRTRDVERELKGEMERHKHSKEELGKARSALMAVKTQSQHDLKRRDTEQLSTLTRLQRLSSDPSQSKFIVLNPISLSSSLPPTPASILHSKISSSEVTLLEESLRESHEGRMECEGENRGLREVLGEVGEWCEGILDLRGIGREGLDEDEGDQSREIPNPSHSTPLPLLAHSLHKNLFHIRTSFLNVLSSTDIQIISAREEVEVALERERLGRVEEKRAREVAEVELERVRDTVRETQGLVEAFTNDQFLRGAVADEEETVLLSPVESPISVVTAPTVPAVESIVPTSRQTIAEQRSRTLDFLAFLGDSPAPVPTLTSHSIPTPRPIKSSIQVLSPLSEHSEISSIYHDPPPAPLIVQSTPLQVRKTTTQRRSALLDILAVGERDFTEILEGEERELVSVQRTVERRKVVTTTTSTGPGTGKKVIGKFR